MNSRVLGLVIGGLLLVGAPGCGTNSPTPTADPSVPAPPSPTAAAPTPPAGTAPGPTGSPLSASPLTPLPGTGRNPEVRAVAVLKLISDPGNPLGLTPQETKELGEAVFRAGQDRDQTRFRQSVLYPLVGDLWSSQLPARNWKVGATPESEFLQAAQEALPELDKRAGGQKATPAPLPAELKNEALADEPVDEDESDYEKAIPAQDRLTLMNLGYLILDVAPDLEPAKAAKVAAETRELVDSAQRMQKQWEIIAKIATKGDREAKVTAEESKVAIPDLGEAHHQAQMWADGVRGD